MIQKIIFLGSSETACFCLNMLNQHRKIKIQGVATTPPQPAGRGQNLTPSPVFKLANTLNLPVITPNNLNTKEFLQDIKNFNAKWAVATAYGRLLPVQFLNLFPNRAFNFHASLLPRWRGAAPIQRAIMAGDPQLGLSLQIIQAQLDTGPIVCTNHFTLTDQMDAVQVFQKMNQLMQNMLPKLVQFMEEGGPLTPQDNTKACTARKIQKYEAQIVWQKPARQIFNQIRALAAGPQSCTFYKGKRLKILQADPPPSAKTAEKHRPPGQIITIGKTFFTVACGDAPLKIMKVQPESKKAMPAGDYLCGAALKPGDQFETK